MRVEQAAQKEKRLEFPPDMRVSVLVPLMTNEGEAGELIETTISKLEGGWKESLFGEPSWKKGIDYEIGDFSEHPEFLKTLAEKGARIFKTNGKRLLAIHSEESLQYSKEIQEPIEHEEEIEGRKVVIRTKFTPFRTGVPMTSFYLKEKESGSFSETHFLVTSLELPQK